MTTPSADTVRPQSGRILLLLGLALAVVGLAAYIVQIRARVLAAPWYLPIATTVGVLLVLAALVQTRGVWRLLMLLLLTLVAGAEWTFLIGTRLPAYNGPILAGAPFPAFSSMRSDGTTFTQRDLGGDKNDVLVFFRGRW
jgi:hypothetical protein